MRSLTSISCLATLAPTVNLYIDAVDASTTYVHCGSFVKAPVLSWAGDPRGGLAGNVNLRTTLSLPLADIKARLRLLRLGTARLQVTAGTDTFWPFHGKVWDIRQDPQDPNTLEITALDPLTVQNPLIPEPIDRAWFPTPHPLEQDIGWPLYYGLHHRPFFFVAVTSDVSKLLGPRNVSSANHVTSLYFHTGLQNL